MEHQEEQRNLDNRKNAVDDADEEQTDVVRVVDEADDNYDQNDNEDVKDSSDAKDGNVDNHNHAVDADDQAKGVPAAAEEADDDHHNENVDYPNNAVNPEDDEQAEEVRVADEADGDYDQNDNEDVKDSSDATYENLDNPKSAVDADDDEQAEEVPAVAADEADDYHHDENVDNPNNAIDAEDDEQAEAVADEVEDYHQLGNEDVNDYSSAKDESIGQNSANDLADTKPVDATNDEPPPHPQLSSNNENDEEETAAKTAPFSPSPPQPKRQLSRRQQNRMAEKAKLQARQAQRRSPNITAASTNVSEKENSQHQQQERNETQSLPNATTSTTVDLSKQKSLPDTTTTATETPTLGLTSQKSILKPPSSRFASYNKDPNDITPAPPTPFKQEVTFSEATLQHQQEDEANKYPAYNTDPTSRQKPPPKRRRKLTLTHSQRFSSNEQIRNTAMKALLFAVFVDAANTRVLVANYPIMVLEGAHPDSFENTAPFDFAAATYFINMTSLLGSALANMVVPSLSDKFGRRPIILINLIGSIVFTLGKYFGGNSFWAFCGLNFANGLFSSTGAVAMAYAADAYRDDRQQCDEVMSKGSAINVIGRACGMLLAIFIPSGLFLPLFPAAALNLVATIVAYLFVLEPSSNIEKRKQRMTTLLRTNSSRSTNTIETNQAINDDENAPLTTTSAETTRTAQSKSEILHKPTMWNILLGAFSDNVGSQGIVPMCISPLMFNAFYADFTDLGSGAEEVDGDQTPIMSLQAFRWIFTLVNIVVIPGALMAPIFFRKYGPAASCVAANLFTGTVIICLLYIAETPDPPTAGTFALFVVILYLSFPFTIVSQLSTAPMLDRIATTDKRGYVQGLNLFSMDFSAAIAPFLYGTLADNLGIEICLWTATAISVVAAMVNAPLIFNPRLKPPRSSDKPKRDSRFDDPMSMILGIGGSSSFDDDVEELERLLPAAKEAEITRKAIDGQRVGARDLWLVNMQRMKRGESNLCLSFANLYPETDEDEIDEAKEDEDGKVHSERKRHPSRRDAEKDENILEEFMVLRELVTEQLGKLNEDPTLNVAIAAQINRQFQDVEATERAKKEAGEWFGNYLIQNGYHPGTLAPILRHMVKVGFPPINGAGTNLQSGVIATPEHVEARLVTQLKILNQYIHTLNAGTTSPNEQGWKLLARNRGGH